MDEDSRSLKVIRTDPDCRRSKHSGITIDDLPDEAEARRTIRSLHPSELENVRV